MVLRRIVILYAGVNIIILNSNNVENVSILTRYST